MLSILKILGFGLLGICLGAAILALEHWIFNGEYDYIVKFCIPGLFWPFIIYSYLRYRVKWKIRMVFTDLKSFGIVILYGIVGAILSVMVSFPFVIFSNDRDAGYALIAIIPACGFWIGIVFKIFQYVRERYSNRK